MTVGAELARLEPAHGDAGELVRRMTAAIQELQRLSAPDAARLRQDAAAVEAASKQKHAAETQLAAAELRLHAERRLGELGRGAEDGDLWHTYSESEWRDFVRLAAIPRSWLMVDPASAPQRLADATGPRRERAYPRVEIDLFLAAVEDQLATDKSHTAYSVYKRSLWMSEKRHAKYWFLSQAWDETWLFIYEDPQTKRRRRATFSGSLEEVLDHRAVLSGRVSSETTKLLPIRGKDPLSSVLDSVRQARDGLSQSWPGLSDDRKRTLDGAYSALDDLATKVVAAVNL